MAWKMPVIFVLERCCATPPVAWVLSGQQDRPAHTLRGSQQWFWRRIQVQGMSEIHYQQATVPMGPKEAQHKRFCPQYRPIHTTTALGPEYRLCLSQPQQVAV